MDPEFFQLGMKSFGKSGYGKLGAAVRQQMRDADFAPDGTDVHDSASSSFNHAGKNSQGGKHGSPEHHIHGLFEVIHSLRLKWANGDDSGIVDQNMDLSKMLAG